MQICKNQCQPNLLVCTGCGRTELERAVWNDLSDEMQRNLIQRISCENHLAHALQTQTEEIFRLNGIIKELTNGIQAVKHTDKLQAYRAAAEQGIGTVAMLLKAGDDQGVAREMDILLANLDDL